MVSKSDLKKICIGASVNRQARIKLGLVRLDWVQLGWAGPRYWARLGWDTGRSCGKGTRRGTTFSASAI